MNERDSEQESSRLFQSKRQQRLDQVKEISSNIPHSQMLEKEQYKYRWGILLCSLGMTISTYYCFDQPSALYHQIRSHFKVSQTIIILIYWKEQLDDITFHYYFILLYIIYSALNIILPIFTGGMRDCNGDRLILIIIGALIVLGQLIFCLGVHIHSIFWIIIGRLALGLGVESLIPIQSSFLSQYFRHKHLSTIFSTILFCCIVGLLSTLVISQWFYERYGLQASILFGAFLAFIGLISQGIALLMDKSVEETIGGNYVITGLKHQGSDIIIYGDQVIIKVKQIFIEFYYQEFYMFKFQDLKIYPWMFWLILVFHAVFCLVNVTINLITEILFIDSFEYKQRNTWDVATCWAAGCILLPLIGFLADRFGKRALMSLAASLLLIIGHQAFKYSQDAGIVILGLAFSIQFSALWSCIVYLIKPSSLGKAYGLIIGAQNIGFSFMPLILISIHNQTGEKALFDIVLIVMTILSIILSTLILSEDSKQGGMLDKGYFTPEILYEIQNQQPDQQINQRASSVYQEDLFTKKFKQEK